MDFVLSFAAVVVAYLVGSLSFAVIVSRVMGLNDPRTYGSKNPGATNVLRSGSKPAAVATLLLDALKGWVPVVLVRWWGPAHGLEEGTMALVGLGAFLGHLFPVFFRFQGGKGVATALGVLLGVDGLLGLLTCGVWLAVALVFRFSSLASLMAAVSLGTSPFATAPMARVAARFLTRVLVLGSRAWIRACRAAGSLGMGGSSWGFGVVCTALLGQFQFMGYSRLRMRGQVT